MSCSIKPPAAWAIDTIAVPSVLAVYNWPKNTDRYRRVERFIQYLFARWDKLIQPPFHPRWRDVNLAATVPGWTRFSVSEEMLRRLPQDLTDQAMARDFQTYMAREVRTTPEAKPSGTPCFVNSCFGASNSASNERTVEQADRPAEQVG